MKQFCMLCLIVAVILPQELYAKGFGGRSRGTRSFPKMSLFRSSIPPKTTPNLAAPMRKPTSAASKPVQSTSSAADPKTSSAVNGPSTSAASKEAGRSSLKEAIVPALIGAGAGYMASSMINGQSSSHAAPSMASSHPNRLAADTIIQNAVILEAPIELEGQTCTKKALTRKGDAIYLNDANEICGVFAPVAAKTP